MLSGILRVLIVGAGLRSKALGLCSGGDVLLTPIRLALVEDYP
jgi:hypothetical protein